MGNCIAERKQPIQVSFDQSELKRLESTFLYYCNLYPE